MAAGPAAAVASFPDDCHSSLAAVGFAASGAAAAAVEAEDVVVAAVAAVDNAFAAGDEGHTASHPVPLAVNHSSLVPI